jgi:hypothetical protein
VREWPVPFVGCNLAMIIFFEIYFRNVKANVCGLQNERVWPATTFTRDVTSKKKPWRRRGS